MEIIINTKLVLLQIFLLNIFSLIHAKVDDLAAIKALSCVSIVTQKYHKGEDGLNSYSPLVLACYIKITEEQAQRVIGSFEEGDTPLESYEIDELTDIKSLKEVPEKELMEKSEELENTIKEFQKYDQDYNDFREKENGIPEFEDDEYDDDDYGSYEYNKMSKKGFVDLITRGVNELFSAAGAIWLTLLFLIILYLLLMMTRRAVEFNQKLDNDIKENEKLKKINNEKNNKEKEKDSIKDKEKSKND